MILNGVNTRNLLHPNGPLKGSILGKFSGSHQAAPSQKFTLEEKKKVYVKVYNILAGGLADALQ